ATRHRGRTQRGRSWGRRQGLAGGDLRHGGMDRFPLVATAGGSDGDGPSRRLEDAGRAGATPWHHAAGDARPADGRGLSGNGERDLRLPEVPMGAGSMTETFAALLLAHVLADFVLQTRGIALNKRRLPVLLLHG